MSIEDRFELFETDGVVVVIGDCDLANAARLETLLLGVEATPLEVNLRGLTFLDSSGLRTLLLVKRARPEMRIVEPSQAVRRVLGITGLDDHFL